MPFAAMTKRDLPQTVTLFNVFRDPESGAVRYYRTILEWVRVDEVKTSLRENLKGATRLHKPVVWIDRRTTRGHQLMEGIRIAKPFKPWSEWQALPDAEKDGYWTLYQQHMLALPDNGQKVTLVPDFDPQNDNWQDFVEKYSLRQISDIEPTVDEDGSIHSWEVTLN